MKLRGLNIMFYKDYLYTDKKKPFAPARLRKDAPGWAKKLYEEDRRIYREARKNGCYM